MIETEAGYQVYYDLLPPGRSGLARAGAVQVRTWF
jgi:hypothetical protein